MNDAGSPALLRDRFGLFSHAKPIIAEAEVAAADGGDLAAVLPILRRLSRDDFGFLLIGMPNEALPALSRLLPTMAGEDIQRRWTGDAGVALYRQTAGFIRCVETVFLRHTGRDLSGISVLDFGCGYGRILRSMLYFIDPENLYGADAWEGSLALARHDRVPANFILTDPVPTTIPMERPVDLIVAYSVFTHLSETAMDASLRALRGVVSESGLAVVTVRPAEFWSILGHRLDASTINAMVDLHDKTGFAYRPLPDTDGHYGDTSMSFEMLERGDWVVAGYDTAVSDPYQIAVALRPV